MIIDKKIKIKVSIAGRNYPLTIDRKSEEGIRKAGKDVRDVVEKFESNYAVNDKQDVLAMCALQFASDIQSKRISKIERNEEIIGRVKKITEKIKSVNCK